MKVILTESQFNRLNKSSEKITSAIIKYMNEYIDKGERKITKKSRNYGNLREDWCINGKEADVDSEIFLHLVESEGSGEDQHMWYSVCDNHNLEEPIPEGECPVVTIPSSKSEALYGFFGDRWKPVFLEWFNSKTGLPVINVDTQGWG